jgi:hypothetical protein
MKKFQIVLLVISMVILSSQLVRHCYVRYFHDKKSVLDRYNKKDIDYRIERTSSIEELTKTYEEADRKVREFEKGKNRRELEKYGNRDEPYYSKNRLENAINDWEAKHERIREVRIFWFAGLLLIMLGSLIYRRIEVWTGISFIIAGFTEMMWWTSPDFASGTAREEFLLLLNTKLLFTVLTLTLMISLWFLRHRLEAPRQTLPPIRKK